MRPSFAVLSVLLTLLMDSVRAWDYGTNSPFGPARWPTEFPGCGITTQQQSPLTITTADSTQALNRRISFHREVTSATSDVYLVTSANGGGLLTSVPSAAIYVIVVETNLAQTTELRRRRMVVHSIAVHVGVEHRTADGASSSALELHMHLSDTFNGPPTMVVSQLVQHSSTTAPPRLPLTLFASALDSIGDAALTIAKGAGVTSTISASNVNLFLNFSNSAANAVAYTGTTSSPPCYGNQEVYVIQKTFYITSNLYLRVLAASNTRYTNRPLQARVASVSTTRVQIASSYPMDGTGALMNTPAPTVIEQVPVLHSVMSEEAQRLRIVVIALGALCVALSIVLTTLVLARWEVIDLPMWLGGIAKPVEFWTNPESSKDYLDMTDEDEDEGAGSDDQNKNEQELFEEEEEEAV